MPVLHLAPNPNIYITYILILFIFDPHIYDLVPQTQLTKQIDSGLLAVASAVADAKSVTEEREAALREQINAALKKMRAYARDMEVGTMGSPCS